MPPARLVERTPERGVVRDRRGADRADADVRRNAIDGESEPRKHLCVTLWQKSMKRARGIGRGSSTPPERGGERVVRGPDHRDHERLRECPRDGIRVACGELAPLAVLADEAA